MIRCILRLRNTANTPTEKKYILHSRISFYFVLVCLSAFKMGVYKQNWNILLWIIAVVIEATNNEQDIRTHDIETFL